MRTTSLLAVLVVSVAACGDDTDNPSGTSTSGTGSGGDGGSGGETSSAGGAGGCGIGCDEPFLPVAHCGTTDPVPLIELDEDSGGRFEIISHGDYLLVWGQDVGGLWSVDDCGEDADNLFFGDTRPLTRSRLTPADKLLACHFNADGSSAALVEFDVSDAVQGRVVLPGGCGDARLTSAGWLMRHDIAWNEQPLINMPEPGRLALLPNPHDETAPVVEIAPDVRFFDVVADSWIAAVREDLSLWIYDLDGVEAPRHVASDVVRIAASTSLPKLVIQTSDGSGDGPIAIVDVVTGNAQIVTYAYTPQAPPYEEWTMGADGRSFVMVDEFMGLYEAFSLVDGAALVTPPGATSPVHLGSDELALPDGSFWIEGHSTEERYLGTWDPEGNVVTPNLLMPFTPSPQFGRSDPWMYSIVNEDVYAREGELYLTGQTGPFVETPAVDRFGYTHAIGAEGVGLHVLDVDPTSEEGTLVATHIATDRSFEVIGGVHADSSVRRAGSLGVFVFRPKGGAPTIHAIAVPDNAD